MADAPKEPMEQTIREDGRYPPEAYDFLHVGLTKAVKDAHGEQPPAPDPEGDAPPQRHVTGKQMCLGLRDAAIERWGMMAQAVLARWNIHATIDFGNMVYLLIRHGHMRKTEEDSIEDFRAVYDFDEAFGDVDHFELTE